MKKKTKIDDEENGREKGSLAPKATPLQHK